MNETEIQQNGILQLIRRKSNYRGSIVVYTSDTATKKRVHFKKKEAVMNGNLVKMSFQ